MPARSPLLARLQLAVLVPTAIALVAMAALTGILELRVIREGSAAQLAEVTRLLLPTVSERVAAHDPTALERWATDLVRGTNLRLTVIDGRGTVLADSARSPDELARMENHLDRPEVRAALDRGSGTATRRSDTTGVEYVYAAQTITLGQGELVVVRVAQPLTHLGTLYGKFWKSLLLASLAGLASAALVVIWLRHRLLAPLAAAADGAHRLASGDLDHRLPLPQEPEAARLAAAINRLAERVAEQVRAAEAERDHLREVLASMSEGVLVTGPDSRARLANTAFRDLFALQSEPSGRTPLEIARQPLLDDLVRRTAREGRAGSGSVDLEDPERRTIALTSAPLSRDGGVVVVARDVSPFARVAEMRRDFVANVSHELKTPLSAIRGYAETLREGALDDPPASRRFVERILAQCARLQALLDDLLTLSRLESVEQTPSCEPVDLDALARRAVELVAPLAQQREVTLESSGAGGSLLGDPDALERMLLNLLENAIKYNRAGGKVDLSLSANDGAAEITVEDTGIGISPETLPRIFERFYRVDKGRSRDQGGTGLGLAIVKHVAQTHGGKVDVESELGKGTRFRVTLPRRPARA
jgi:two-component system phosphate regulon sensor histidine kinase PhoR